MTKKGWIWIGICTLLLGAYFAFWQQTVSFEDILGTADSLSTRFEDNPLQTIAIYVGLYILVASLSVPVASTISLLGGVTFGWGLGFVLAVFSATIGSMLPFLLAGKILRSRAESTYGGALEKLNRGLEQSGNMYFLSARLAPFTPFYALNLISGLTSIKLKDYALLTVIGITPGTLALTFTGNQVGSTVSASSLFNPWLFFGLVVLSALPIGLRHLADRILPKDLGPDA